jgi:hypothetical protein
MFVTADLMKIWHTICEYSFVLTKHPIFTCLWRIQGDFKKAVWDKTVHNIQGVSKRALQLWKLQEFLIPQLDEDDQEGCIHFQQDGAPPHYLGEVREYLYTRFPGNARDAT